MYVTKQIQNKQYKKKIRLHQRSILRQMMTTCDKLGNSFLTKQQSKLFEQRQKQEKLLTKKVSILQISRVQRSTHQPFQYGRQKQSEEYIYVKQSKQIKQIKDLKQKMLPKVNKTNIQKKLKQLTYIRNMGFKTTNKKCQNFKSLTRQQDDLNIINKSWQQFYQDKLNFTPITNKDQSIKYFPHILQSQNLGPFIEPSQNYIDDSLNNPNQLNCQIQFASQKNETIQEQEKIDNKNQYYIAQPKLASFMQSINKNKQFLNKTSLFNLNNHSTAQNSWQTSGATSFLQFSVPRQLNIQKKTSSIEPRPQRISNRNKTVFKQMIKSLSRSSKLKFNQHEDGSKIINVSIIQQFNRNKSDSKFKVRNQRKANADCSIKYKIQPIQFERQTDGKNKKTKKSKNKTASSDDEVQLKSPQSKKISKQSQKINFHIKQRELASERKNQITQKIGLNKQKLQKQNALQLYQLIKGGYQLDPHDVQGQYISLRSFKQAKQNFQMLNNCFKKVKQYRYLIKQPLKTFNDQSFKSLVFLSQIQNKIAPSLFKKIQAINKVVS